MLYMAILLAGLMLACGAPSAPEENGSVSILLVPDGTSDAVESLEVSISLVFIRDSQGRSSELTVANRNPNDCFQGRCWLILNLAGLPPGGTRIAGGGVQPGLYDRVLVSIACSGTMVLGDSLRLNGELLVAGSYGVHTGCEPAGTILPIPAFEIASRGSVELPVRFDLPATVGTYSNNSIDLVFR